MQLRDLRVSEDPTLRIENPRIGRPLPANLTERDVELLLAAPNVDEKIAGLGDGEVLMLENLRFHPGEEANDPDFAKELARHADVFVNDAFGTAHRAHASTAGVAEFVTTRTAGFLMEKELAALGENLDSPERPFVAVLGPKRPARDPVDRVRRRRTHQTRSSDRDQPYRA